MDDDSRLSNVDSGDDSFMGFTSVDHSMSVSFTTLCTSEDELSRDSSSVVATPCSSKAAADDTNWAVPSSIRTPQRARSSRVDLPPDDDIKGTLVAQQLAHYTWPPGRNGTSFVLQEQISLFLGLNSFKRRYPDLSRRPVEAEERRYLIGLGLDESEFGMGLTALRSDEVMELLTRDFSTKYAEFQKVLAERQKESMAAQQKEYSLIKGDTKKMEAMRKKAMEATSSWNSMFNRDRVRERKSFVDIQTMTIQSAAKRPRLADAATDYGPYPVALLPGQYQNFYRSYTGEELNRLPCRTVIDSTVHVPAKPFDEVAERLLEEPKDPPPDATPQGSGTDAEASNDVPACPDDLPAPADIADENDRGEDTGEHCAFCRKDIFSNDRYVECSQCSSCGHPSCLDMTDKMYHVVKSYSWECMECKPCSVCSNLDQEEKMLFCDNCDRGYHTFCVGLTELPQGAWNCQLYCSAASSSGPEEKTVKIRHCVECRQLIGKNNKVHHKSKFRMSGLCLECATVRQRR